VSAATVIMNQPCGRPSVSGRTPGRRDVPRRRTSVRSRLALAMNIHTALDNSEPSAFGHDCHAAALMLALRLMMAGTLAAPGRLPVAWRAVILLDDVSRQSAICGHREALLFGPRTDLAATVAAGC
jgi:hypothetical protein